MVTISKLRVWDKMSEYYFIPERIDFEEKRIYEQRGFDGLSHYPLYRKHLYKDVIIEKPIGFQDTEGIEVYENDVASFVFPTGVEIFLQIQYSPINFWYFGRQIDSDINDPYSGGMKGQDLRKIKIVGQIHTFKKED